MDRLIEELKKQHEKLLEGFEAIFNDNTHSISIEKILKSLKDLLLDHVKKEDEQFYPVLYKAADKDDYIKTMTDIFIQDFDKIYKQIQEYYDKYFSGRNYSKEEFITDSAKIMATLRNRIHEEENILFPLYERAKFLIQ